MVSCFPVVQIIDSTNSDFLECLFGNQHNHGSLAENVFLDSIVQMCNEILKREFIVFLGFLNPDNEFQRHQNTYPGFYHNEIDYDSLKARFKERAIVKILHSHYPNFVEHLMSLQSWAVIGQFKQETE